MKNARPLSGYSGCCFSDPTCSSPTIRSMSPIATDCMAPQVWFSLVIGLLLRLAFMIYGLIQDETMEVKYTDVDYFVFTDAAQFVSQGQSPYNRATYRYTPLLAWILQPNITCTALFGKLLFIACDVAAGYMIYELVRERTAKDSTAIFCSELWLLNPLPIAVSSRGNAESIMAVLVLATLHFLLKKQMSNSNVNVVISGAIYGLSVHTKIYPVTYALAIYLFLSGSSQNTRNYKSSRRWPLLFGIDVFPNVSRCLFVFSAAVTFLGLTWLCYLWCGMDFIQETYLHHVTRRDTRHNMSLYFYMFYLLAEDANVLLGIAAFIPQVALLVISSIKFHGDLPFCCFFQTFVFVTFNKVCTSQYFLWYLSLLPLIVPSLKMSVKATLMLICAWFAGQAIWLYPAYLLEFKGMWTFYFIWRAGILFFLINTGILWTIVNRYKFIPVLYEDIKIKSSANETDIPSIFQMICHVLGAGSNKSSSVSSSKKKQK